MKDFFGIDDKELQRRLKLIRKSQKRIDIFIVLVFLGLIIWVLTLAF